MACQGLKAKSNYIQCNLVFLCQLKLSFQKKDLNLHTYKLFQGQRYKRYNLNDLFSFHTQSESQKILSERKNALELIMVFLGKGINLLCTENRWATA